MNSNTKSTDYVKQARSINRLMVNWLQLGDHSKARECKIIRNRFMAFARHP